ncbi:MAG: DUF3500 domain-containing protein [bacterium]|nr:DUF3500 domain-containing protein [bacterium]
MANQNPNDRRQFIKTVGAAAVAGAVGGGLFNANMVHAAEAETVGVDNHVAEFYKSLSEKQRKQICFSYDHALRQKINANWHITKPFIVDDFYSDKQRTIIDEIVKGITSEKGYERLLEQMEYDDGGIGAYSVAMFGTPGKGPAQWELTGRHLTLRADGNYEDKAGFGGPIVYGHAEESPKDNVYHYQTLATNKVFDSLEGKQRKQALIAKVPRETAVQTQDDGGTFPGVAVGDLTEDQQKLVKATLATLMAPHSEKDVAEVMSIVDAHGGVGKLHMAFYQQGDINTDKVWDIWRVEGPSFVWHFRGAPHVHAYINIGAVKA